MHDHLYLGYLGDNLKWCGSTIAADGIEADYQNCPGYELLPNCKSSAERAFWTIASEYVSIQRSTSLRVVHAYFKRKKTMRS